MKVIFKKHVEKIGRVGDIKEVSDGYARNYLIPNGLAAVAIDSAVAELEKKSAVKTKPKAETKINKNKKKRKKKSNKKK